VQVWRLHRKSHLKFLKASAARQELDYPRDRGAPHAFLQPAREELSEFRFVTQLANLVRRVQRAKPVPLSPAVETKRRCGFLELAPAWPARPGGAGSSVLSTHQDGLRNSGRNAPSSFLAGLQTEGDDSARMSSLGVKRQNCHDRPAR